MHKEKIGRVYVCHTYYHVLVAFLKELNNEDRSEPADLIISLMSTSFGDFPDRVRESKVFRQVILFDEKRESNFPEVAALKKDRGNVVANLFYRVRFTKAFAKAEAEFIPVDFKEYRDIYVFCDADPIGYYLNQNRIYYHSVEDGLDTLKVMLSAKYDNRSFFALKKFMSMRLNLIFIRDGYSKYCIDMEVNDISCIKDKFYKYKEVPRNALIEALTPESKELIIKTFVKNIDELRNRISEIGEHEKTVLILTEPLCALDVRERLFGDLIEEYQKEGTVFLKPHPRDDLDYKTIFPSCPVFDRSIPMEIFNFFENFKFDKLVSVYTQLGSVKFAKEKVYLGNDFMDKYEDPALHRINEAINIK